MNRPVCLALALAAFAVPAWAAEPARGYDVLELVYFGRPGPRLLRLEVSVNGQAPGRRLDDWFARWVKHLDRDGDGKLNDKEVAHLPNQQGMLNTLRGGTYYPAGTPLTVGSLIGDRADRLVTAADVAAFYRKAGVTPLAVTTYGQQAVAGGGDALFAKLDADGDGKLTEQEAAQGVALLRSLDLNDDERLAPAEVAGGQNPFGGQVIYDGRVTVTNLAAFYAVPADRNTAQLTALLLSRYDTGKDGRLNRTESGLRREVFEKLDDDADGGLDVAELGDWLDACDAVIIPVAFKAEARPGMMAQSGQAGAVVALAGAATRTLRSVTAEGTELVVKQADGPAGQFSGNLRQTFASQFRFANPQNKPALSKDDLAKPQFTFLARLLPVADANGDDALTEAELLGFAELQGGGRDALAGVTVREESRGLFLLLDADRNGWLSPRELLGAWARLRPMDRDGDGRVAADEFRREYTITVHRGPAGYYAPQGRVIGQPQTATQPAGPGRGPLWFQRMDVNADGDVSPREFLGTPDQFRRFDANDDGLIDADEAAR